MSVKIPRKGVILRNIGDLDDNPSFVGLNRLIGSLCPAILSSQRIESLQVVVNFFLRCGLSRQLRDITRSCDFR